ncbi:MAG: response regulator transcription factor [Lachnospiraceae bacterium]|nr:response regulator transcription factor [Candidatus Colinaster equi]
MKNISILIVEDEPAISNLIKFNLEMEGYNCTCAYDGEEAANLIEDNDYSLILLDIMLPKINGYELMEYIRPLNIPTIFLTAKSSLNNKINGLNLGAEDYITKPFEIAELIARVGVVLRRYNKNETTLTYDNIVIDNIAHTVTVSGQSVYLTPKEYELLVYLISNKGKVISKVTLYEKIWDAEYDDSSRTLELHMQRLRKKTGLLDQIKTIYKSGYRLD